MDREQEENQFLGLFGIYKESNKIITSCSKTFSQIALTLILPLSFIFLIHIDVSNILFRKIMINTEEIIDTPQVVYTIASIYTARDVSFKTVMSVVPQ
ncbi:unnamed protein product [Lathyrus oleraceus]